MNSDNITNPLKELEARAKAVTLENVAVYTEKSLKRAHASDARYKVKVGAVNAKNDNTHKTGLSGLGSIFSGGRSPAGPASKSGK